MSYTNLVLFDAPTGFWEFPPAPTAPESGPHQLRATAGPELIFDSGFTVSAGFDGPIVGESRFQGYLGPVTSGFVALPAFDDGNEGQPGSACALSEFTIELWYRTADVTPASIDEIVQGQLVGGVRNWDLQLSTIGQAVFNVRNDSSTLHTVGTVALSSNTWHHIVATIDGGSVRIYTDGVQSESIAWTGTVLSPHDNGERMIIGDPGNVSASEYARVAFYPTGMPPDRVDAHYEAGVERGFAAEQFAGARAHAVLDAAESSAPRRLDPGVREMTGSFQHGQPVIDELRQAARAEGPDGMLFVSKSGEIVLLDSDHRSSAPYNTVQATFSDDGTGLPYESLEPDYSDAFVVNEWNLTRTNGPLHSSSDTASIATYGPRGGSQTDLPLVNDADVAAVADALIAKTKDPIQRITSITLTTADPDVTEAVFRLDLGSRIRIIRHPPGGGAAYDQTSFVQSIKVTASNNQEPWVIVLGVSPL